MACISSRHGATVIYVIEFFLKIISEGLIRDPFTYFRNPFNYLDLLVISTSLVRPLKSVSILYWTRILKLIQLTPGFICHIYFLLFSFLILHIIFSH